MALLKYRIALYEEKPFIPFTLVQKQLGRKNTNYFIELGILKIQKIRNRYMVKRTDVEICEAVNELIANMGIGELLKQFKIK
jgi:hypothetical protein